MILRCLLLMLATCAAVPPWVQIKDPSEEFSRIYKSADWGKGEAFGDGSGMGSSLEATEGVRRLLARFIMRNHIRNMSDAPCGTFHWMPHVLAQLPRLEYHGYDAAAEVVERVAHAHNQTQRFRFSVADLTQPGSLPTGMDLIFSRDALQHLALPQVIL